MKINAETGEPLTEQEADAAEHNDRINRVRSAGCSKCGAGPDQPCRTPNGKTLGYGAKGSHHSARWDAYYAAAATAS